MLSLNLNILWTFINLIIIYFVLKKFLFKPVNDIIEKREELIKNSINDAEKAKIDAEELKLKYENTLKNTDIKTQEIIKNAEYNAKKEYNNIIELAKNEADKIRKNAENSIKEDRERALKELQLNTTDIIIMAAQKVAEKSIQKDKNTSDMIDAFLSEVGE